MDHVEESIIYSSRDYGKFKLIEANRAESTNHIKNLIASISGNPELSRSRPILINGRFEIIDGQHRFQAWQMLGLPVYYSIEKTADIGTARSLNSTQRNWRIIDYLRSYVSEGNEIYSKINEIWEEYPIPLTQLLWFLSGRPGHSNIPLFKGGEFKLMKDKKTMYYRLDSLRELAGIIPWWSSNRFIPAYWTCLHNKDFDPNKFLSKVKIAEMKGQPTSQDYLREMERVYNFHEPSDKFIRLF